MAAQDITGWLREWQAGDLDARDSLLGAVYDELHGMASSRVRGGEHTLRPTALVHDAMLRLFDGNPACADRAHFFALAALKMRAVLVDHARARTAAKRGGGGANLTLSHADAAAVATDDRDADVEVLALHQALEQLSRHDTRAARAVEMVYFGGMAHAEIARVLQVAVPTVERDLRFARAWLNRRLS